MKAINIMENTIENKKKLFAQYFGQRVWRYFHTNGEQNLLYVDGLTMENKSHFGFTGVLELKPLAAITEEDAIEVAKMVKSWDDELDMLPVHDVYEWMNEILSNNSVTVADYVTGFQASQLSDYLRSKGYALPWNGISIEQQIEWGWIKIKQ